MNLFSLPFEALKPSQPTLPPVKTLSPPSLNRLGQFFSFFLEDGHPVQVSLTFSPFPEKLFSSVCSEKRARLFLVRRHCLSFLFFKAHFSLSDFSLFVAQDSGF